MQQRSVSEQPAARLILLAAGSVAVGVHAGLAPEHLDEWPPLGALFIAAAIIAAAAVTAVGLRPADSRLTWGLLLVLAGLVGAYLLTRLVALPPVDPDRESLDTIGVVTVAAELAGVIAALRLLHAPPTPAAGSRTALSQGGTQ
jgi:hypothetical protein